MKITFAREENNIYKTFFPSFHRKAVLPSDFPRRGRAYDQASYKCHEWRNLSLYAFPVIAKCLEPAKLREKKIFTAFGFLSRAYRLPEDEYEYVPREMLNIATNYINDNYTQAFGETAGSYNYHMVSAHLPEIRERQGPFTMHNAYPFEGSYAEMRKSFIPGTRKFFYCISFIKNIKSIRLIFILANIPKQIMQRIMARKFKRGHICDPKRTPIKVGKTPKCRDDLIYTKTNGFYSLFRVQEIDENGDFNCTQFNVIDKTFSACPALNFGLVGTFKNQGFKSGIHFVRANNVAGKVILNQGLLFTVPDNVLIEK